MPHQMQHPSHGLYLLYSLPSSNQSRAYTCLIPLVVYRAFIIQRDQCLRIVIPYCTQRRQFAFQGSRVVHGFAHLIVSGPPAPLVTKSISPPTPCPTNTSPSLRISSRNTTFSNRRPVSRNDFLHQASGVETVFSSGVIIDKPSLVGAASSIIRSN